MKQTFKRIPNFILSCVLLPILVGFGAALVNDYQGHLLRPADWVAQARQSRLAPCFGDAVWLSQYNELLSKTVPASDLDPSRIIPDGLSKGIAVPVDCFAVATGLYGVEATMWKRPTLPGGGVDMTAPYYTPTAHMERLDAQTQHPLSVENEATLP